MDNRRARRPPDRIAPFGRAVALFNQREELNNEDLDDFVLEDGDDTEGMGKSPVYDFLEENDAFETFTNFSKDVVVDIWRLVDERMGQERRRGPKPIHSSMDHLLLYLVWLKSGSPYSKLSSIFGLSESRLEDDLNRVRGPLHDALVEKWWANRRRPKRIPGGVDQEVGLIIDGHTTEIATPKMTYQDAKVYYDGKNHIYGYKNEIAVAIQPPHFCLFISPHYPGSVHDYTIHKTVFRTYGEYLQMTPDELILNGKPHGAHFWKILADKGYIGNSADTHPIERVCPVKATNDPNLRRKNQIHSNQRVVIEQFFGRLATLWTTMNLKWRYDEAHFDDDLTIACLLTNEHLAFNDLEEQDQLACTNRFRRWTKQFIQKQEKRAQSVAKQKEKKLQMRRIQLGLPLDADDQNEPEFM